MINLWSKDSGGDKRRAWSSRACPWNGMNRYTLITSRTWNAPIYCSRSAITTNRVFSLTLGLTKLSDNSFLTVLLQDHVGGLQVLHDQYWVDVPPVLGALVVNSGDFLQLITNGKFISVFWRMQLEHSLCLNKNLPFIETDTTITKYSKFYRSKGFDGYVEAHAQTNNTLETTEVASMHLSRPPSNLENPKPLSSDLLHLTTIPTIDLEGRVFEDETKRKNTVDEVKDAAEK
ncbi:hypothetical protein HID58_070675 [Brassica napus]|uniref:Isopenicillin N synthase-like Fe(2+) 2OG dioxygenase domain-containing protein n=3 Tax=Brassica TaxID=3705 RepID=A0ABQ7YZJ5_BRANA|nr:hypothetical protein HID58_070675 [Brassica napus]